MASRVGLVTLYAFNSARFSSMYCRRWSYLTNLTLIGNAIYVSMDIPDVFLAVSRRTISFSDRLALTRIRQFSKILNYLQFETGKTVSFGVFLVIWT